MGKIISKKIVSIIALASLFASSAYALHNPTPLERKLIQACNDNATEKIIGCLIRGANPNTVDVDGKPAFMLTIQHNNHAAIQAFLEKGVDPNITWGDNGTPFNVLAQHAFKKDAVATAQRLLDAGADINAQSRYGTALHRAIETGLAVEFVDFLVDSRADISIRDFLQRTPLQVTYAQVEEIESNDLFRGQAKQIDLAKAKTIIQILERGEQRQRRAAKLQKLGMTIRKPIGVLKREALHRAIARKEEEQKAAENVVVELPAAIETAETGEELFYTGS